VEGDRFDHAGGHDLVLLGRFEDGQAVGYSLKSPVFVPGIRFAHMAVLTAFPVAAELVSGGEGCCEAGMQGCTWGYMCLYVSNRPAKTFFREHQADKSGLVFFASAPRKDRRLEKRAD
jgi:hypothetical protein